MGIRSLISFGFILVPVAITIGVLVGLDAYRSSTGGPPLFPPDTNTGTGSGGGTGNINPNDDSVKHQIYCQNAYGIKPASVGEQFTLNPNKWNWNEPDPAALCVYVDVNSNGSYATAETAPSFWVTWQYPQGDDAKSPTHAYPNIKLDTSGIFPIQLSSIGSIATTAEWHYSLGSSPSTVTSDLTALAALPAAGNIAFDMFMDADQKNAQDASKAQFEVMVWLGVINVATTRPLGTASTVTITKSGATFTLYYGQNQQGQTVLTWYPNTVVDNFDADLKDFIDALQPVAATGAQIPASSDYLGYIAMGTEAFYAVQNLTFNVPSYTMQLTKT